MPCPKQSAATRTPSDALLLWVVKLLIHAQTLHSPSDGIRRCTVSLIHAMARQDHNLRMYLSHIVLGAPRVQIPRELSRQEFDDHLRRVIPRWRREKSKLKLLRKLRKGQLHLIAKATPFAVRKIAPDLLWAPSPLLPAELRSHTRYVASVHDLAQHYDVPGIPDTMRRRMIEGHGDHLEQAEAVVAISEWTRQDTIARFGLPPARVRVVPGAADDHFAPVDDPALLTEARRRFNLPEHYLLHVGSIQPRKGLVHLIRAHRQLRAEGRNIDLVLVGGECWLADHILAEADHPESREYVHIRHNVPDAWLPAVYCLADLFVMPSLLEGFGIPLLEAMACGVPTVATTAGALPEVAGGASVLVPPADDDAIATAIRELLESPSRLRQLRSAGLARIKAYSWEHSARTLLSVFMEATGA